MAERKNTKVKNSHGVYPYADNESRRIQGEDGQIIILPPETQGNVWNGSAR